MKPLKTWFLGMCGLMVLTAAILAPIVVNASCPKIRVLCSDNSVHSCAGEQNGDNCTYSESCLNC
jgi:hypothetical protein